MQFTRRNMIAGTGSLGLIALSGTARASMLTDHWGQVRRIFGRHWSGGATTPNSYIEGGEFGTNLEFDFGPADDMTFSGSYSLKTIFEGSTYRGTYNIQGYFWGNDTDLGVNIERATLARGDSLPSQLFWQGYTGQLELYKSKGTADDWLLDGTLRGTVDGAGYRTNLSDS